MYEFHDDYTESKHCNKSRLLFDDTDILMYETKGNHLEYIGPRKYGSLISADCQQKLFFIMILAEDFY